MKLSKSEGEGAPGTRQQWDCSRSRCTLSGSLSLGCFRVLPRYPRVWGGMWEPLADAECKAVWWKLVVSEILNSSTATTAPSLPAKAPLCELCPRCRVNMLLI